MRSCLLLQRLGRIKDYDLRSRSFIYILVRSIAHEIMSSKSGIYFYYTLYYLIDDVPHAPPIILRNRGTFQCYYYLTSIALLRARVARLLERTLRSASTDLCKHRKCYYNKYNSVKVITWVKVSKH